MSLLRSNCTNVAVLRTVTVPPEQDTVPLYIYVFAVLQHYLCLQVAI